MQITIHQPPVASEKHPHLLKIMELTSNGSVVMWKHIATNAFLVRQYDQSGDDGVEEEELSFHIDWIDQEEWYVYEKADPSKQWILRSSNVSVREIENGSVVTDPELIATF